MFFFKKRNKINPLQSSYSIDDNTLPAKNNRVFPIDIDDIHDIYLKKKMNSHNTNYCMNCDSNKNNCNWSNFMGTNFSYLSDSGYMKCIAYKRNVENDELKFPIVFKDKYYIGIPKKYENDDHIRNIIQELKIDFFPSLETVIIGGYSNTKKRRYNKKRPTKKRRFRATKRRRVSIFE